MKNIRFPKEILSELREPLITFTVEEGMREIPPLTFANGIMERLILPPTVKEVSRDAFIHCRQLREIIFLSRCTTIHPGAFSGCPETVTIRAPYPVPYWKKLQFLGLTYLRTTYAPLPDDRFLKDRYFRKLTQKCASDDTDAMMELADYFQNHSCRPFGEYAATFWRWHASCHANPRAAQWCKNLTERFPEQRIPSILPETLCYHGSGRLLCHLGFPFFDPSRTYSIRSHKNRNAIAYVSSFVQKDLTDYRDSESLRDWWLLDTNLHPIPGVRCIRGVSSRDLLLPEYEKLLSENTRRAHEYLEKRFRLIGS